MIFNSERMRERRKFAGLTQKRLGELCGINEAQLRRYETGKGNPKIETVEKIAAALCVHVSYFYSSIEPLIEEDYAELRDRFGEYVEFVVRDMISGKGERWKT